MKRVLVVTGTRAEYGLLYWTMKRIKEDSELELQLIVTGSHLVPEYGLTVEEIKRDGFIVDEEIDMIVSSRNKSAIVKSMGLELIQMSQTFDRLEPDLLLILGDRYETFIAATCAMMMNIPIAHINGGESTEGAIDEQIRHAITKMSHIHFPGADQYKDRIIKMGEESWRVHNVGQSGIENIKKLKLMTKEEVENDLQINLDKTTFLITYHPVTLDTANIEIQIDNLLESLLKFEGNYIFTYPNSDFGSEIILQKLNNFVNMQENAKIFYSLGQKKYLSLLKFVDVMVGNSSSGILEAPIMKVPVVNIGDRQKGRLRNKNIIDVGYEKGDIINAINMALYDNKFKKELDNMENLYGDGEVSQKIVSVIKNIDLNNEAILCKKLNY